MRTLLASALIGALLGGAAAKGKHPKPPPPTQDPLDYFVLSREWPPGYCAKGEGCQFQADRESFTIHGLWPNYDPPRRAGGSIDWGPSFCGGPAFDEGPLYKANLMGKLRRNWPSYQKQGDDFWEYEWDKHGSCADPVLSSVVAYFSKALELHAQYNLTRALEDNGIFPSNTQTIPLADIQSIFDDDVPGSTTVECTGRDHKLYEVHTCLSRDLTHRIACPPVPPKDLCQDDVILRRLPSARLSPSGPAPVTDA